LGGKRRREEKEKENEKEVEEREKKITLLPAIDQKLHRLSLLLASMTVPPPQLEFFPREGGTASLEGKTLVVVR
jgi:hypothetical protein